MPGPLLTCRFKRSAFLTALIIVTAGIAGLYVLKTCIQHLVAFLVLAILAMPAGADPQRHLSEEDMARRLAFIEERLNAGRTSARYWQYGWSGFFAANMAAQGYMTFNSNDGDNQAKYAVGAVKSAAALAHRCQSRSSASPRSTRPINIRHRIP